MSVHRHFLDGVHVVVAMHVPQVGYFHGVLGRLLRVAGKAEGVDLEVAPADLVQWIFVQTPLRLPSTDPPPDEDQAEKFSCVEDSQLRGPGCRGVGSGNALAGCVEFVAVNVRVSDSSGGGFITGFVPTSVDISPGATSGTLEVRTQDDRVFELNGSVTAEVTDDDHYDLGSQVSATVTVKDDDPFVFRPLTLALGGTSTVWTVPAGIDGAYLDVDFSSGTALDQGSGSIMIERLDSNGDAIDTHLVRGTSNKGVLSWVTADSPIRVSVDSDAYSAMEPVITLRFHVGSDATGQLLARGRVKATAAPVVSFSSHLYTVPEGSSAQVTVTFSGTNNGSLTIPVTVSPGTAEPNDYSVSGLPGDGLTFSSGEATKTFTITANQDSDCTVESMPLEFGTLPAGVTVGAHSSAAIRIEDDDTCPPPVPTNVGLHASDRTLTFTWNGSTEATSYFGRLTSAQDQSSRTCSPSGGTTSCTFTDLNNGQSYDFEVQALTLNVPSAFASPVTAMPGAPAVTLTDWERSVGTGESHAFRVRISGLSPVRSYQVRLGRENPDGRFGFTDDCSSDLANPRVSTGAESFIGTYTLHGCDTTALIATGANADVKATFGLVDSGVDRVLHREEVEITPSIDVEPRPLRMARLSWQPVPNAKEYVVEYQETGGSWSPLYRQAITSTVFDVSLDSILPGGVGLADSPYAYEFRVRAQDSTSSFKPGGNSAEIIIQDNPILMGGRATGNSPGGHGQAILEWPRQTDATEYIIRYRKLGFRNAFFQEPDHHTSVDWAKDEDWPYYHATLTPVTEPEPTSGTSTTPDPITGLDIGDLYAFQVNYRTDDGMVYAARDAYVWPSDKRPNRASRVGTFPFFGYWEGGNYDYLVCEDTFPSTNRGDWKALIPHAFEQWELAAPDLVTVTGRSGVCHSEDGRQIDNNVPITVVRALHNEVNEVYMVDVSNWGYRTALYTAAHSPLFACIWFDPPGDPQSAKACVISPRYWDMTRPLASESSIRALDDGTVDVLVNVRLDNDSLDVPGNVLSPPNPDDTRFNQCRRVNPDDSFENYETMVHESGHALGLSGFEYKKFASEQPAHSYIPDSVMNYNHNIDQITDEPDCSPHPFDVMALEALYQTVRP